MGVGSGCMSSKESPSLVCSLHVNQCLPWHQATGEADAGGVRRTQVPPLLQVPNAVMEEHMGGRGTWGTTHREAVGPWQVN